MIRTEHYGIFLLMKPEISGDGIEEIKSVTGYSLEKKLENKQFFLEEGTFNFWNPATPDDTILGRILEVSPGWKAGYVAPSLIGRYRTFDQYDDYALSFCMMTQWIRFAAWLYSTCTIRRSTLMMRTMMCLPCRFTSGSTTS